MSYSADIAPLIEDFMMIDVIAALNPLKYSVRWAEKSCSFCGLPPADDRCIMYLFPKKEQHDDLGNYSVLFMKSVAP